MDEHKLSEVHLRSLLENATDFAVYRIAVDPDHLDRAQVIFVSPSITEITGIRDPYRFESWFDDLHPDDRERVIAANERALRLGQRYDETTRFYNRLKEQWVWVHTVSTPWFDDQERVTHFDGLVVDVTEQRQAEAALQHQIAFENLVTSISTQFINLELDKIDDGIERALQAIGGFMHVDRSYVFTFSERGTFRCTHEWCAAGIEPQVRYLQDLPVADWNWSNEQILEGRVLHVPLVSDLPPEAAKERQEFQRQGIQSLLVVPMAYRGRVVGFLGFDAVRKGKVWPDSAIALLQIVGEVFSHALEHKRSQQELQHAYQTLEQRVEERTRELSTLLQIGQNIVSTLELGPLLGVILDQLGAVVSYSGASIRILEQGSVQIVAYRGPISQAEALRIRYPLHTAPLDREVVEHQVPVIVPDTRGETPSGRLFRDSVGDELDTTYAYTRSWIGLPLVVRGRVIGLLTLDHSESDYYSVPHARLAMAFANQSAIAIENAQLYREEQARLKESEQRRQVAEGLRDIIAVLNSGRPRAEALNRIVAQANRMLGSNASVLHHVDYAAQFVDIEARCGLPSELDDIDGFPLYSSSADERILDREPVMVSDFQAHTPSAKRESGIDRRVVRWRNVTNQHYRSWLAVPLVVENQVYGSLAFYYRQPRPFRQDEVDLGLTLADQAALAIENAHLRAQAEQAAVAAERNRLARDLHDAVTQTLFSASLIAEVLPRIWERKPEEGLRRLAELRELTRGALAEMRTLLLELRPSVLVEANMGDLLRQLCESVTGRARLPVEVEIGGLCDVPAEAKVALYRIAQEALHNAAKHARASQVWLCLSCTAGRVTLSVRDDGCGFDLANVPADHFGLSNMRERAQAIGATLTVESAVGAGTRVKVIWQDNT
jgi:PAS domain S-box-containing protein